MSVFHLAYVNVFGMYLLMCSAHKIRSIIPCSLCLCICDIKRGFISFS